MAHQYNVPEVLIMQNSEEVSNMCAHAYLWRSEMRAFTEAC